MDTLYKDNLPFLEYFTKIFIIYKSCMYYEIKEEFVRVILVDVITKREVVHLVKLYFI